MSTGKRQISRFQRPHSGLTTPRQETYFATDSIDRCLVFTQLSLNVEPSESKTARKKTEFYMK